MRALDVIVPVAALALGAGLAFAAVRLHGHRRRTGPAPPRARILFPFVGRELSERALQATLRLAWAEQATVVPAYLATVPLPVGLEAPVGRACEEAFTVFEAIEQRAGRIGVPVDGRVARGRNVRHALRELIDEVPSVTRIVIAAAGGKRRDGFSVDDIAWLLRNAPGEVLVIRPGPDSAGPAADLRRDPLLPARPAA